MINITIRLLAPLAHGSFDTGDAGNLVQVRRVPVLLGGEKVFVPAVSGNALRGRMRRVVFRDLLRVCGIGRDDTAPGEWDALYAALCNGGHLDSSEQTVKPDRIRQIRDAVPALSVFGAALRSWMLPGRCSVGICWPVCAETAAAGLVTGESTVIAEDLVHEYGSVRHVDRDRQDPELSGVTPMPVLSEALVAGTVLQSRIRFEPEATLVERAAVAFALDGVASLGAKSSSGLGDVDVIHNNNASDYLRWREESAAGSAVVLREMAAAMAGGRSKKKAGKPAPDAA